MNARDISTVNGDFIVLVLRINKAEAFCYHFSIQHNIGYLFRNIFGKAVVSVLRKFPSKSGVTGYANEYMPVFENTAKLLINTTIKAAI